MSDTVQDIDCSVRDLKLDKELAADGTEERVVPSETDSKYGLGIFPVNKDTGDQTVQDSDDDDDDDDDSDDGWQTMPAVASYNVYNQKGELEIESYDNNNLAQEGSTEKKDSTNTAAATAFSYTKVGAEEQAQRSYKLNKKTDFLFDHKALLRLNSSKTSLDKNSSSKSDIDSEFYDEYEDGVEPIEDMNPESQLGITKDLLSDKEKLAYAGAIHILANEMAAELATACLCADITSSKKLANRLQFAQKSIANWKTDILKKLYEHLGIQDAEIQMIEKLSIHGIELSDLCKCLRTTQNIDNPWEQDGSIKSESFIIKKDDMAANDDTFQEIDNEEDLDSVPAETLEENNNKVEDSPFTTQVPTNIIEPSNVKHEKELQIDVAWTIVCDLFLIFLQDANYDARSRTLLLKFANVLNITNMEIYEFEKRITDSLDMEQSTEDQVWDEQQLMTDRRKKNKRKKLCYVGLAMVGGSLVLGLSGGLLAPVIGAGIAAGLSTIGVTGATGFLTGVGGTATVAVTSTAIGANIGARGMSKRMGSVRTFEFRPLHNNRRVNLILSVSGWMIGNEDDVRLPFSTVDPIEGDLYSLHWEPEMLKSTGQTINIVASEVFTQTLQQVLGATILTAFMASIQWPMALSKLGYIIDNPWNVSLDRAWAAGLILADTLINKNLGQRPITLVGFSLGSRVIFSCLIELCKRKASGLIENVYLFGTPTVQNRQQLVMARASVSGRFVNGYSDKDWVLAYLFRATAGGFKAVMGISPVDGVDGIENFNCTDIVDGHMSYRKNMPKLLKAMGVAITSEEFVEIEENIDPAELEKQRKLIHDVDAAQKKLSDKKKKHNSWVPKWMKPRKSKWQSMVEEVVEEGHDQEHPEPSVEAPKLKHKDSAIVDHGALMRELYALKKSMHDGESNNDDKNNTAQSSANSVVVDSPSLTKDNSSIMDMTKPENQIYSKKPPQSPNNFSLLSAGRPILPKDDDMYTKKREISYSFADDI